jgi:hypothetical protein
MIATAVLLLFVLVMVLAWYGFVPLNWSMVTHAFLRRRSADQEGWVGYGVIWFPWGLRVLGSSQCAAAPRARLARQEIHRNRS